MKHKLINSALLYLIVGTLQLSGAEAAAPQVAAPAVQLSPSPFVFGYVTLGDTKILNLTVTNTGDADLVITGDEIYRKPNPFEINADGCVGKTIRPGGSCVVQLLFGSGDEYFGVFYAAFVIFDNAGGGYQHAMLYAWDEPNPVISGSAGQLPPPR
jgi:hypothetical protein